jgi:beta-glucanase (GH16 family)
VDHGQGNYCQVTNSAGAFHTYTLEWSPTTMTFSYDGHACWTFSGPNPEAPLAAPQPFDKPFFITLQLALGYGVNAVTDSSAFPAKFVVDYVRAWK